MNELWQPAHGFEGFYEVSSLGRVRGLERLVKHPHSKTGYVTRPAMLIKRRLDSNGYLSVHLHREGHHKTVRVHMLVAKAFLLPCPGVIGIHRGQWTVDHIDNNKMNNAAKNLQWLPCDQNFRKDNCGEKHPQAKLSRDAVAAIRADSRVQREIAMTYGVSQSVISEIKTGKLWAQCP